MIQVLRDTGQIKTEAGQRAFKVCKDILTKTSTGNIFGDYYPVVFEEAKTVKEKRELSDIRKRGDKIWEKIKLTERWQ